MGDEVEVRRNIGFAPQHEYTFAADRMPSWPEFSKAVNKLVFERDGEWAGLPMPLPGSGLILESRHPWADRLHALQQIVDENGPEHQPTPEDINDAAESIGWRLVNSWQGHNRRGAPGRILIFRNDDGRTQWGFAADSPRHNELQLRRFETLDAWDLDTECKAMDTLADLLTERMFKAYVLTGGFLETSKRSGLIYWFRRMLPTVVVTPHRHEDELKILCALCLHPIGYYENTHCGAMCPTDDVIAHLLLMRGDEHLFWRRANQHQPHTPESGL